MDEVAHWIWVRIKGTRRMIPSTLQRGNSIQLKGIFGHFKEQKGAPRVTEMWRGLPGYGWDRMMWQIESG